MKSIIKGLTTATAALFAVATILPEAQATLVTLEGYGSYKLANSDSYYPDAPVQRGRYESLGDGYYHRAVIKMDYITNRSRSYSGDMSFELWGMSYYNATTGLVLMTRGINPVRGKRSIRGVRSEGSAISIKERRFPELNLYEYTSNGWSPRDHLTFSKKAYL
jgi:hypothetical protein